LKIIAAQLSTIGVQLNKPVLDPQLDMRGGRETDLRFSGIIEVITRMKVYPQ